MTSGQNLILVVADKDETARNIKDLLEFMEADTVEIANARSWREHINERRLSAVFVGPDLPSERSIRLLAEIGDFDPTVSIVVVDPRSHAAA